MYAYVYSRKHMHAHLVILALLRVSSTNKKQIVETVSPHAELNTQTQVHRFILRNLLTDLRPIYHSSSIAKIE
jgi:hypothetical protein